MLKRDPDPFVFDPAYRPKDAAKYCGCSAQSLIKWGVPRERIHRSADGKHDRYVYRRSVLNQWLASQGKSVGDRRKLVVA